MSRSIDHLVIGAGIIGAAIADALSARGEKVLVIDRGLPGHGCSFQNAGWVTPCFATPLPRPGVALKALQWMADPASPFYMRLPPTPANIRWLARFLWSSRPAPFRRGTGALVALSKYSLDAYRQLDAEAEGALGLEQRGLLMLALTEDGLRTARADAELMERLGVRGEVVDGPTVTALDPAYSGRMLGGVYYPDEAHVEPLAAVHGLLDRAVRHGAEVQSGVEVFRIRMNGTSVRAVSTTHGEIVPGNVVLAAGMASRDLVTDLGVDLPLLGGKGYSMTLTTPGPTPRIPAMVVERKVAITPAGPRVRVAGTLELVRRDSSIVPSRVEGIASGAGEVMPGHGFDGATGIWRGLRPCTPDGLPIIGRTEQVRNLFVATGHQMLGLQTAPATGRLIADLVLERDPVFDPTPFRAERF